MSDACAACYVDVDDDRVVAFLDGVDVLDRFVSDMASWVATQTGSA